MMSKYNIPSVLAEHPLFVVSLVVVILVLLLAPSDIINDSHSGIRRRQIRALLWSWEWRPGYTRLHLPGLRRFQGALFRGLLTFWHLVCGRVLAGIAEMLRHWLR